ncbi:SDR family NAD(P)-dependent oxidoreductase [Nibrella saemangeumensis]|uniref:SDR family NAD(P)-dependent oxidoreductase n=1 Tax=Nibrella saemangeumensis TaxID=1084526 RepID=A0ABP8N6J8_9BACT
MLTNSLVNGTVALITGASRGVGKGIAHELGLAGATVIVTGRSTRSGQPDDDRPGTIEDTADLVTASGGKGIAIPCDHTSDEEVKRLFARIQEEFGRLDILVNNVWGGYEGHEGKIFSKPFWEQDLDVWETMFRAGLRAHFTASYYAAPLMIAQQSGLIINISIGVTGKYLGNVMYDTCKTADDRLAFAMAQELHPHGVTAVALYPGHTRTERVERVLTKTGHADKLTETHSPRYVGRAVVALAQDPHLLDKSGQSLATGDLAALYGFTDVDGRLIPAFTF